ncbi:MULTISPECIES: hypothetical protein [unclassified Pseudoclavibacter]|uniref:hypothetical protein n=1 Tax=unclassified Pseudoclavibacter TaxID=2615177 RepID=UPI0011B03191|nr:MULTISPECIES: hypothetical protein [unclassified Pseudoclavibacter]
MAMISNIATFIDQVLAKNDASTSTAAKAIDLTGQHAGFGRPGAAGHSLAAALETFFRAGGGQRS